VNLKTVLTSGADNYDKIIYKNTLTFCIEIEHRRNNQIINNTGIFWKCHDNSFGSFFDHKINNQKTVFQ